MTFSWFTVTLLLVQITLLLDLKYIHPIFKVGFTDEKSKPANFFLKIRDVLTPDRKTWKHWWLAPSHCALLTQPPTQCDDSRWRKFRELSCPERLFKGPGDRYVRSYCIHYRNEEVLANEHELSRSKPATDDDWRTSSIRTI